MTEMNQPSKETRGNTEPSQAKPVIGATEGDGVVVIYATFPSLDSAKSAARRLVEQQLAACANIIPGMVSIYRWDGSVQEDHEVSVIFKTRRGKQQTCVVALLAEHPYTTPAVVVWDVIGGSEAYLDWVRANASAA